MSGYRVLAAMAAIAVAALPVTACRKASPHATVTITAPIAGDTIRGTAVHVTLEASGIELAPVAEQRPGTAHHHLFLDADATIGDDPIPAGVPGIVHLGNAQTEFHWEGVAPGQHRIIAVLGDPAHIPVKPLAADTVTFVVVAP